jgi:hypothetical protein
VQSKGLADNPSAANGVYPMLGLLWLFLVIAIPAALAIGFELLLTSSARKNPNEPDLYDY